MATNPTAPAELIASTMPYSGSWGMQAWSTTREGTPAGWVTSDGTITNVSQNPANGSMYTPYFSHGAVVKMNSTTDPTGALSIAGPTNAYYFWTR